MPTISQVLQELDIPHIAPPAPDAPCLDIVYNSKKAAPNTIFVCLVGAMTDGHRYAADAYDKGARVFVAERALSLPSDAMVYLVPSTRRALAVLSAAFFGHPEKELDIIGITGTKGKSTIAELIRHILRKNHISAASVGTVGVRTDAEYIPTVNTTPESYELFRLFREFCENGITHVVIEVSSQGLKLDRVYGIPFAVAVMTNLSEDHIGEHEHRDFEEYKACKKMLFAHTAHAVMNIDDPYFEEFSSVCDAPILTYSTRDIADFHAERILPELTDRGYATSFHLEWANGSKKALFPFPGKFSVSNALAAVGAASLCGIEPEKAIEALSTVFVKGRFETVETPIVGATFVIDYAHNGESLTQALLALRAYHPNRLICLVGSVGGRTEIRRQELGIATASYADLSILTADNPDKEDPADIILDMEKHMGDAPRVVIPDRAEAIEYAVSIAGRGDIVLFAGKGHENYQLINGKKLPFSERELIQSAAERLSVTP